MKVAKKLERVLFVHAHPDDETISTGGTIALLGDAGVQVSVLTCTRGELGEVVDGPLAHLANDSNALTAHRIGELDKALKILGVQDHWFLGENGARKHGLAERRYLDSGMAWLDGRAIPAAHSDPNSFCAADPDEIEEDLVAAILSANPDLVISYDAGGGYGHPDHMRAAEVSRSAAELLGIPFSQVVPESDHGLATDVVDISAALDRKKQALRAYASQLTVKGGSIVHSGGQEQEISTVEAYLDVAQPNSAETGWRDMGMFWKIAAGIILAVMGAVVGIVGTINSQVTYRGALTGWPIGLVLGLLVSATVLIGLRLYLDYRPLVACAAIGFLAPIILFSQQSFAGSVLIPTNDIGYTWFFGSIVIAIGVVVFPRLKSRARVSMNEGPTSKQDRVQP